MRRKILVAGATGKQGHSLIRALLNPTTADSENQYHIYALTRKASSPSAQHIAAENEVTVVEGDLDIPETITKIFEQAKPDGGIWGVYSVLAFPGLGASADGEERQGKMLADIALEYGVSAYIYSSARRAGPKYENDLKLSGLAKARIEQHCMSLGEKGLPWTIIRPVIFMENFDGFIGSITFSVLKTGLKPDTEVALISSEDIGNVAAGVFRNHEQYIHKTPVLSSEFSTISQMEESYKRAMGRSIPAVPKVFAWLITKANRGAQDLLKDLELSHTARMSGDYSELDEEIKTANSAYPMKTYHDWLLREKEPKAANGEWNKVSIGKLLTGRV
ncbi:hypothetical protein SERLA73DRAFT_88941 [Serpula lacrymans var. lacrymans S7.3]|uniref:NmrA-like domain-containing protein n=2 Tax=Serpula lacrymans var. lacrymans TaxID=341189 RepID=F8PV05_SERL3|nr:uncharacterized protein SERLADRAFT_437378 [Serpula lacrymans var. lacrymans S7.9]EGO00085.1 hypothetical protein SERLA73DRAFT_88941 [Serpula lacrymans var. lacrymans S7.3]EGO25646.1 hypothetical protein SERLADRAFT_437378 [Serpula lacrymans var. lacrymans S7.9]